MDDLTRDTEMCTSCFEAHHGCTPEMGDDETSFAPGKCSRCGRNDLIVFWLTIN